MTRAVGPLPVRTLVARAWPIVHLRGPGGPVLPHRSSATAPTGTSPDFKGDPPGAARSRSPQITCRRAPARIGDASSGRRRVRQADGRSRSPARSPRPDPRRPVLVRSPQRRSRAGLAGPAPVLMDRDLLLEIAEVLGLDAQFIWDAYLALTGLPFDGRRRLPPALDRIEASSHSCAAALLRSARRHRDSTPCSRSPASASRTCASRSCWSCSRSARSPSRCWRASGRWPSAAGVRAAGAAQPRVSRGGALLAAQASQAVRSPRWWRCPSGCWLGLALARSPAASNGPSLPGTLFPIRIGAGRRAARRWASRRWASPS